MMIKLEINRALVLRAAKKKMQKKICENCGYAYEEHLYYEKYCPGADGYLTRKKDKEGFVSKYKNEPAEKED